MEDQAQAPVEQAVVQQVQVVQPLDVKTLPVEERVRRAMFPEKVAAEEKPRGPDGKFLPTKPQEPDQPTEEVKAEAPADVPAETSTPAEETPQERAERLAEEEWEPLKNRKILAKVDGEELEVTLEEARLGYMRQADYQRKTQDVSKQRSEAQEQARQAIEASQRQYGEQLAMFQQAIVRNFVPELQAVNWQQLKTENPQEYIRLSERAQQLEGTFKHLQQEAEKLKQEQEKTLSEKRAKSLEEARSKLKELIPDFSETLQKSLFDAGIEHYGFTVEELNSVMDPRVVKLLHDGMQYHKMKTQKPLVEKRVAEAPRVVKPGAKPNAQDQARAEDSKLKERLRKSGGKDIDAIAALVRKRI